MARWGCIRPCRRRTAGERWLGSGTMPGQRRWWFRAVTWLTSWSYRLWP
uniref:Uncharacterized protein n=1 Tax=Anguilla anguilla TaxID=7936 RepID=A0A0E9QAF7_ANGAN